MSVEISCGQCGKKISTMKMLKSVKKSARKINKIVLSDYSKIKKPYWLKLYLN